jgi:hypothetical protein
MRGLVAAAIAMLALAAAPGALAAQRFAAPAGTGTECTQAAPCQLAEAVEAAKAGDEVIVTAGTYPVGATIGLPSATNVQVHGDPGGPPPRITATLPGPVLEMYEAGDSIGYLDIENDDNGGIGVYCTAGHLERMRVTVVGAGGFGVLAYGDCNSIRNSLLITEGAGSTALRTIANIGNLKTAARNVTAISSGSMSSGVSAEYGGGGGGSFTLELENSIARGGEQDLKPSGNVNGAGIIAVTHSNFDTARPGVEGKVIDGGGNQTAAPLFVNSENGDYREAAGSPTIDAGLAGELGPLDLGGNPRVLGAAPDIGAFEFVPPPAPGQIQSLAIKPGAFRAGNLAGAAASRKKKPRPPLGAVVTYSLSAAGSVELGVERQIAGRRSGKTCVKLTAANKAHKKCSFFKSLKGSFSVSGVTGPNSFRFSGKLGGKPLKPGSYRLTAAAGGAVKKAVFKIVK